MQQFCISGTTFPPQNISIFSMETDLFLHLGINYESFPMLTSLGLACSVSFLKIWWDGSTGFVICFREPGSSNVFAIYVSFYFFIIFRLSIQPSFP